jgi:hypothetical protein
VQIKHKIPTSNSVILGGMGTDDLILSIQCMTTPLTEIQTCIVYCTCTVYTVYVHFYTIRLFLMEQKCNGFMSIVVGMVHSDRTVVDLHHKHFRS